MRIVTRKLGAFISVSVAAALFGGLARAEPGVTDNEIRIGMWTPLSGPVALLGQSARDGVRLWVKETNDKGGIQGRKINFIAYDDAGSPQEFNVPSIGLAVEGYAAFNDVHFYLANQCADTQGVDPPAGPHRAGQC